MNLHSFYDAIALDQNPDLSITRPMNDSYRAYLEHEARDIMNTYPPEKEAQNLDPHHWSVTAYQIAVDTIYPFVRETNQITLEFQAASKAILKRQIALGGYRLAGYIASLYRQPRA
jgi:hypothetical protein